MQTKMTPIEQIRPYAGNPRNNEEAVDGVVSSIRQFGWRQPIVVDEDGVIIVGHTRYEAAKRLKMDKVPVHTAKGLSPQEVAAYRLADNKTGEVATWNEELLAVELSNLRAAGEIDLGELGFGEKELAQLLKVNPDEGQTAPDDTPAPLEETSTEIGDVFCCGRHRVICGDAGSPGVLFEVVDKGSVAAVHTDPPYNTSTEPRSNNAVQSGASDFQRYLVDKAGSSTQTTDQMRPKDRPLANDAMPREEYRGILRQWFSTIAEALGPGAACYIWGGWSNCAEYPAAMEDVGLHWSQQLVWVKQSPVIGRVDFMLQHEWCFYGWKKGGAHRFFGENNIPDVWPIDKLHNSKMVHLTQKPVEIPERAIQCSTLEGEVVLDPFGGSGSTLIAAERLNRVAVIVELDPRYVDVIVRRWEQFTGQQARKEKASVGAEAKVA